MHKNLLERAIASMAYMSPIQFFLYTLYQPKHKMGAQGFSKIIQTTQGHQGTIDYICILNI
jgi:hypothetical protein